MFNLMVSIALAGQFSLASSVRDFVTVAGGGVVIGVALGVIFLKSLDVSRIHL